jgi:hypothetical protein
MYIHTYIPWHTYIHAYIPWHTYYSAEDGCVEDCDPEGMFIEKAICMMYHLAKTGCGENQSTVNIHTYTHTHTHTYIHIHIHTYICTHHIHSMPPHTYMTRTHANTYVHR